MSAAPPCNHQRQAVAQGKFLKYSMIFAPKKRFENHEGNLEFGLFWMFQMIFSEVHMRCVPIFMIAVISDVFL